MNFEANLPKNSSLEDFFSGVFNSSSVSHSFMMNDEDSCLDDNVNEFFGNSSPIQDPFFSHYSTFNNNNNFYATSFQEQQQQFSFPEQQQQPTFNQLGNNNLAEHLPKSSSILSLTDFKPTLSSISRTSSATSFSCLHQTPSLLHNGESSPLESFQQMDDFQRQLNEDFLRNGGVASLNISNDSAFKPRIDQHPLFKFNKQIDFLNSIPKSIPTTETTNEDIFASLNDMVTSTTSNDDLLSKDDTTMDTTSVSSNSKQQPGLPPGHKIINGEMYNDRGYKICGFMNQHNRPCQRIGKCPFHDRMKSEKSLDTNSDGIIAAQDSIEPEQYTPTQLLKEKKKSDKKSQKKNKSEDIATSETVASKSSLTTSSSILTSSEASSADLCDKPTTKKPYKQGWTKEEHILFLKGLEQHGKGSWKEISAIVGTRSPTQIQSHAQKYFLRQKQQKKNKRSIHDFTMDDMKKHSSLNDIEGDVEANHKRKRNKSKSKESKKAVAITEQVIVKEEASPTSLQNFDESMFKKEIFGETFVGDVDSSSLIMKQFSLSPPKQETNYMEIINKLNHLKSFAKQNETQPSSGLKSAFESFPTDELDFHFSGIETTASFSEQHSDLYDAWDIGTSFLDTDAFAPFQKKQKM